MIVGTAGHVDHGKTTLVKALTGVDTDRFEEEKRRGLTIDLGFAYTSLADGEVLGFVDVPGHERFIHNMLSGITGIDYVLLVVAADDGPMPQTREHLAIVDLLRVTRGAIAITKIDSVEAAQVESVTHATRALVAGTGLERAPIIPLSAQSGENLSALIETLAGAAEDLQQRPAGGRFRLAVDRCFTLKGAGTVVTGTVFAGRIENGQRVLISPGGREARVKALHAHNEVAETAIAGQRCALNLSGPGIDKFAVRRGDWVIAPDLHAPTDRVDAILKILPSEARALKHWTPVHVHIGAADINGRVAILESDSLASNARGLVQLVLSERTPVLHGDRFIIRDQSATRTIGGGRIIDPFPPQRGRRKPERLALLRILDTEVPAKALSAVLEAASSGLDLTVFARAWNLRQDDCRRLCDQRSATIVAGDSTTYAFSASRWQTLRASAVQTLRQLHAKHPDKSGFSEADLNRAGKLRLQRPVVAELVKELVAEKRLTRDGVHLRLPEHRSVGLDGAQLALWTQIEKQLRANGSKPPKVRVLSESVRVDERRVRQLLKRQARDGAVYEVSPELYFPADVLHGLARETERLCRAQNDGSLSVGTFRETTGLGRNLSIELLEFFDRRGLTVRVGDGRRLQKSAAVVFQQ